MKSYLFLYVYEVFVIIWLLLTIVYIKLLSMILLSDMEILFKSQWKYLIAEDIMYIVIL